MQKNVELKQYKLLTNQSNYKLSEKGEAYTAMKKYLLLILSFCISFIASAHAGMYDRFIEHAVTYTALFEMVLAVSIVLLVPIIVLKLTPIKRYERGMMHIIESICRNDLYQSILGWFVSSISIGLYLILVVEQIFMVGIFVFLFVWLTYIICSCIRKWRNALMLGIKAIYFHVNIIISQVIGIIAYECTINMEFFKNLFKYTDEEYQMANYYVYPRHADLLEIGSSLLWVMGLFAIPFIFIWAKQIYRMIVTR